VALLTKIHHAVIDGMSGAEIMGVLLDLGPEPPQEDEPPRAPRPEREPSELEMLLRGMLGAPRYVERVVRSLPSTVPNVQDVAFLSQVPGVHTVGRATARMARLIRGGEQRVLERTNLTAPKTSFNGRVSAHRRFAFGQLSLEAVKRVKNEHDCTVNDVVLTICAGALRWWLLEHDELPDGPLIAQVPVSVRSEKEMGTYGNRIGMLSVPLYVNESDPVVRLRLTHESMGAAKHGRLQRFRSPVPALHGRRAAGGQLPRLGDHRRHGAERHRDELLRPPGLRDRRRPRADAGRMEADRLLEDSLAELLPPGAEVKPPAPRLEESLLPGLRPAAVGAAHRGRDLSLEHEAALTGVERLVLQRGQLAASARRRHRRSAPSAGSWRLLAGGGVVLARGAGLTAPRSEAVTSLS